MRADPPDLPRTQRENTHSFQRRLVVQKWRRTGPRMPSTVGENSSYWALYLFPVLGLYQGLYQSTLTDDEQARRGHERCEHVRRVFSAYTPALDSTQAGRSRGVHPRCYFTRECTGIVSRYQREHNRGVRDRRTPALFASIHVVCVPRPSAC